MRVYATKTSTEINGVTCGKIILLVTTAATRRQQ